MKTLINRINQMFEQLPDRLRWYRLIVWPLFIILIVIAGIGMPKVKIDMTMESFFKENDPVKALYDRFRDTFGSDDSLYVVYKAKNGDIFSEPVLRAIKEIQEKLERPPSLLDPDQSSPLDHIIEVKTLINVSYLEGKENTLISREFIGDNIPTTTEAREKLRQQALAQPDYPLFYLSKDSKYGGIWIRTDFGAVPVSVESDKAASFDEAMGDFSVIDQDQADQPPKFKMTTMPEYAAFNRAVNQVIESPEYKDLLEFYPVGNAAIMGFFNDVLNVEFETLFTGALLLIMIVLLILFRSVAGVVLPVVVVVSASVLTLGIAGWMGVTMSMMVSVLIMLILVVGVADSIHVMSGYLFFRTQNQDHRQALRTVMGKSGLACLLTSLTTAIGLLALVLVPIRPIRVFGGFAALGVGLAFLVTVTILPLLMDVLKPVSKKHLKKTAAKPVALSLIQRFINKLEPFAYTYPKLNIAIFGIIMAIALYGVSQVRVDSNLVEIIKKGLPIRKAHELVDRVMGGTQNMEIFLDFKQQDALKDPKVLDAMDEMQSILESRYPKYVVRTDSLVNVVKESFKALNEGKEDKYIIPQNQRVLEQTLLLFDSANPEDRQMLTPDDYSKGRISVRLVNYGSSEYLDFFEDVKTQMTKVFNPLENNYPQMTVQITGNLALMLTMIEYISWSQIQSFGLALLVITLLMFIVFGSPKVGLVAMIPNLFPVAVTFGTMGLFGFALDADTLIIAPVVIGIAVDDTIHFLTHYRLEYSKYGDTIKAIVYSMRESGQAIVFSSVILAAGFLILVTSNHQGMANFGILSAIAFASALLADLILLPALCVLFEVQFKPVLDQSPSTA